MSAPLFVNSSLILTEIPAALLALYCFGFFTGAERKRNPFVLFICLALLPWFHLKFAVLSAAGALIYTAVKLRTKEKLLPEDLKGFAAAAVSFALFAWFYFSVFGTKAAGLYTKQDFYFIFDAAYMLKAFFAVQFDRNYGLLVYAPVYAAALWGMAEAVLKKEAEKIYGVIFACAYACVYLFWNDWTGSMTPARQLIPSVTVFAFFGLMFINSHNLEKKKLFLAAAGLSVFTGWLLAALPILRYASSRNKIFTVLDAKAPGFMWFFPDFNAILTPALAVSALYFLLIITAFFYIRAAKKA